MEMNISDIERASLVMQAYANLCKEGKRPYVMEYREKGRETWTPTEHPTWNWDRFDYRFERALKSRPLRMSDMKPYLRLTSIGDVWAIQTLRLDGITVDGFTLSFEELYRGCYEHGPTLQGPWSPCCMEE